MLLMVIGLLVFFLIHLVPAAPDLRRSVVERMGEGDNFWPASAPSQGPDGVCGPCSEIFFHTDKGSEVPDMPAGVDRQAAGIEADDVVRGGNELFLGPSECVVEMQVHGVRGSGNRHGFLPDPAAVGRHQNLQFAVVRPELHVAPALSAAASLRGGLFQRLCQLGHGDGGTAHIAEDVSRQVLHQIGGSALAGELEGEEKVV